MRKLALLGTVIATLLASAGAAHADGVDVGEFHLTAGLGLEAGYSSNVFFEDSDQEQNGSLQSNITPSLGLTTPRPRAVDFMLSSSLTWQQYMSQDANVRRQSGPLLNVGAGLRLAPNAAVSFFARDNLSRTNEPAYLEGDEPANRLTNTARFGLTLHPGGAERTARLGFSGELAGQHRIWRYDANPDIDRSSIGAELEVRYNFLPMTAAFLRGTADWISYQSPERSFGTEELVLENAESNPLRVMGGLSGLIGRRATFRLAGGYGVGRYSSGPDVQTYLLSTGLGYVLSPRHSVDLTYRHGFTDSTFGNYSVIDRVQLKLSAEHPRVKTSVTGFVQFNQFSRVTDLQFDIEGVGPQSLFSTTERRGTAVGASFNLAFPLADWISTTARYHLQANFSEFQYNDLVLADGSSSGSGENTEAYVVHGIFVGLSFSY